MFVTSLAVKPSNQVTLIFNMVLVYFKDISSILQEGMKLDLRMLLGYPDHSK
jgi:hypothetical protein